MLEIYLDHKFQWQYEVLKCESLAYDVVVSKPQALKTLVK